MSLWDGIFTAYNSKQMCRAGAITPRAPARAQCASRPRSRASRPHGLMLMVTAPRKLEWACCKTKWVRLFILLLQRCPQPAQLRIKAENTQSQPYGRWRTTSFPKPPLPAARKPADCYSEIRIQKLAREGTWNRLKGHITILYALCTHSIPCGWHRLLHQILWFYV